MAKKYDYETAVYVDPFPGVPDDEIVGEWTCSRCGGTGFLPYRLDGGRCFKCKGVRPSGPLTAAAARRDEREHVKRVNTRRREEAKAKLARAARIEEYSAEFPIWARVDECSGSLLVEIVAKVAKYDLSDKQIALVAKLAEEELQTREERLAKRAAEEAKAEAMGPIAEGRREIRGIIASIKWEENSFSPWAEAVVKGLIVEESGHKVWGTIPAALLGDGEDLKGRSVVLTATVKRSDRDEIFGFMSRPSKASFVKA